MAADMLGEHWNEREAVPLLIKVATGARYSVGRLGGLLGLEKTLNRLPVENDAHKDILNTLRKISPSDPSKYVKENAKAMLRDWRESLRK